MPEIDLTQNLIPSGTLMGTLAVGAGTTDYNALENKPSINSVTLTGNKTTSDLNISYTDLTNKPTIPDMTVTSGTCTADPESISASRVKWSKQGKIVVVGGYITPALSWSGTRTNVFTLPSIPNMQFNPVYQTDASSLIGYLNVVSDSAIVTMNNATQGQACRFQFTYIES